MSESTVTIRQPVHICVGCRAVRCSLPHTKPGQHPTKASLQPYAWGTGTRAGDRMCVSKCRFLPVTCNS